MLRKSLHRAQLSPSVVAAQLAGATGLDDPEPWLDVNHMGELLARAAVGGHAGANAAMQKLLRREAVPSAALNAAVSLDLRRMATAGSEVTGALALDLALATESLEDVELACEIMRDHPHVVHARSDALHAVWQRAARLRDVPSQRSAYRILNSLVAAGLDAPVTLQWLHLRLHRGGTELRWPLVRVTERLARSGQLDPAAAVEALQADRDMEPQIVERAHTARLRVAAAHPDVFSTETLMDIALEGSLKAERAVVLTSPLTRLAEEDPGAALELLARWVEHQTASAPRTRGSRDTANALRPAVREIASRIPADAAPRMLALAHRAEEALAEVICGALAQRQDPVVRAHLDEELRSGRLPGRALGALRAKLRSSGREAGNEGWPELIEPTLGNSH